VAGEKTFKILASQGRTLPTTFRTKRDRTISFGKYYR